MSRTGPSVIQFSVLDSVSDSLLLRLADRLEWAHGAHASNNVAPALYQTATRDDCNEGLREALDGIAALASDDGSDVLLAAGVDRDVDLARAYGTTSAADLAVLTYLEHTDVFSDARAQVRAVNHRLFAVFVCTRAVPLTPTLLTARLPWLEKEVSARLREHGRPQACRAVVTETGGQLVVDIVVQCTPSLCVTSGGGEVLASRKRQDTLVFDRSGGCASIHARNQCEVEFYRALAGRLVCDDPHRFRARPVFQLRRLLCPSEWEFGRHSVPGLSRVVLRGLEVEVGSHRARWRGADDLPCGRGVEAMLERAERCTRVEFELYSDGRAYPCIVEILPPNRICLDQRAIGGLAAAYLKARGMFVAA